MSLMIHPDEGKRYSNHLSAYIYDSHIEGVQTN